MLAERLQSLDRTHEVAGSSPASSIRGLSCTTASSCGTPVTSLSSGFYLLWQSDWRCCGASVRRPATFKVPILVLGGEEAGDGVVVAADGADVGAGHEAGVASTVDAALDPAGLPVRSHVVE